MVAVPDAASPGPPSQTPARTYLVRSWNAAYDAQRVLLVGAGRVVRTLTTGRETDEGTSGEWTQDEARSADGAYVAWIDIGYPRLVFMKVEGASRRRVVANTTSYAWAPTGHDLVAASNEGRTVRVIAAATGHATVVTPSLRPGEGDPTYTPGVAVTAWYPSGLIGYRWRDPLDGHCDDLYVAPAVKGAPLRRYDTECQAYHVPEPLSLLSPDGRRVVEEVRSGYAVRAVLTGRSSSLRLTSGAKPVAWLSPARLLVSALRRGRTAFTSYGVDDHRSITLATFGAGAFLSGLATPPDGRRIVMSVMEGKKPRLVSVSAVGSGMRTIAAGRSFEPPLCLRPGRLIAAVAGGVLYEIRDRPGARPLVAYRAPGWSLSLSGCS
jgi:hypothetical protein